MATPWISTIWNLNISDNIFERIAWGNALKFFRKDDIADLKFLFKHNIIAMIQNMLKTESRGEDMDSGSSSPIHTGNAFFYGRKMELSVF